MPLSIANNNILVTRADGTEIFSTNNAPVFHIASVNFDVGSSAAGAAPLHAVGAYTAGQDKDDVFSGTLSANAITAQQAATAKIIFFSVNIFADVNPTARSSTLSQGWSGVNFCVFHWLRGNVYSTTIGNVVYYGPLRYAGSDTILPGRYGVNILNLRVDASGNLLYDWISRRRGVTTGGASIAANTYTGQNASVANCPPRLFRLQGTAHICGCKSI